MGLTSFKFSWSAPKTPYCEVEYNGCSSSSKVLDFGTNRKRLCNFLLVINGNLGTILPRFRYIAGFLLKQLPHPIPPEIWGCSLWTRLAMLRLRRANTLSTFEVTPHMTKNQARPTRTVPPALIFQYNERNFTKLWLMM